MDIYSLFLFFASLICPLVHGKTPSVNKLPHHLLHAPPKIEPDLPKIDSSLKLSSDGEVRRAIVGYLSDKDWSTVEFLAMIHASFRYLTSSASSKSKGIQMDLIVFAHPRWGLQVLPQLCTPLDLDSLDDFKPRERPPTCYVIPYPLPPHEIWHGYEFVNNVHFFSDPRVSSLLTSNYEELMKTDFDCFLTPHFLAYKPEQITFGIQEYALLPETRERIREVAGRLGLIHRGRHNLGPAWIGPTRSILEMANRSLSVLYHILTEEFEQLPCGGVKQNYMKGEGFPLWSAGMGAMYATELIANHFIEPDFTSTLMMDHHGDSLLSTNDEVLHIHCRHGDGDFSKFEFFHHHYDRVDLNKLDPSIVKDYATLLAAGTWRSLNTGSNKAPDAKRDEL